MFGLVPFERRGRGVQRKSGDFFDIDSIFENIFNDAVFPSFYSNSNQMKVDISEKENEYILEAELPGINKEDINIEINDKALTISANRDENIEEKKDNYLRKERRRSSISRTFSMDNVLSDKITAKYENGILTLVLPKNEEVKAKTRKIDIS